MKAIFLVVAMTILSVNAFAREPKATLCGDKAKAAGVALFKINNPGEKANVKLELIDMDHSEGGVEIWDVRFTDKKGTDVSTPYRFSIVVDGCVVFSFSMPAAG